MTERVVVTGIGIVSSLGLGIANFCDALKESKEGISTITAFDTNGFEHDKGGQISNFDANEWVSNLDPQKLGRSSQFAVAATRMALKDANILDADVSKNLTASVFGTTNGESVPFQNICEALYKSDGQSFPVAELDKTSAQNIAMSVTREFALRGETLTISTACAAGNYAVGTGYDMVRNGEVDYAICGGSDSLCRKTFAGFYRLGTMAPEHCQPFDANRKGMMAGEGSAVLILEPLSKALARNARIYAEVKGYGMTCDADHMVSPNSGSIARCINLALENSQLKPEQIDYICAHGTGTTANDITEASAINQVYGKNSPYVSSVKSLMGHGMGAASLFGAVSCCLAIQESFLPPNINLETQDPECDINIVANTAINQAVNYAQNNGFAFGGNNAITIFGRY